MKLENVSDNELSQELERRRLARVQPVKLREGWPESPVGTWRVTTEGDVEGNRIVELGAWSGHIVDIANHLASQSYYSLRFWPQTPYKIDPSPTDKTISISLDMPSGTWDMDVDKRAKSVENWLRKETSEVPFYEVEKGQYFASVKVLTHFE